MTVFLGLIESEIYPYISAKKYIPISLQTNIFLYLGKQIYPYASANKYILISLQTNISLYLCKQIYPYISANKYIPIPLQTNISLYHCKQIIELRAKFACTSDQEVVRLFLGQEPRLTRMAMIDRQGPCTGFTTYILLQRVVKDER